MSDMMNENDRNKVIAHHAELTRVMGQSATGSNMFPITVLSAADHSVVIFDVQGPPPSQVAEWLRQAADALDRAAGVEVMDDMIVELDKKSMN